MDYIDRIQEGFTSMREAGIDFYEVDYQTRRSRMATDVEELNITIGRIETLLEE